MYKITRSRLSSFTKTNAMRKSNFVLCLCLFLSLAAQSQRVKFGVHIDPAISFLNSSKKYTPTNANFNFGLGVELDYSFVADEDKWDNYAFTFGAGFCFNKGGGMNYKDGGILLANSEIVQLSSFTNVNRNDAPNQGFNFTAGTSINYSINYVEIPLGLKLRTDELGQSYLRAYFHLPTLTPMFRVDALGNIDAPTSSTIDTYGGKSEKENIVNDVNLFQLMIGAGAGVEWSPDKEGGLRVVGGFYYNYGFLNTTKQNSTGLHNIGMRLGVIF